MEYRSKAMQVISENMKPDIACGQWFCAIVPTIPIKLEARDNGHNVSIRLHLGMGGGTILGKVWSLRLWSQVWRPFARD